MTNNNAIVAFAFSEGPNLRDNSRKYINEYAKQQIATQDLSKLPSKKCS